MQKKTVIKLVSLIAGAILSIGLLAGCGSSSDSSGSGEQGEPVKATANNGVMVGSDNGEVISYLGVPYAEQPVGDLRWKAPKAAKDSDEEIQCTEFGNVPLQYEWPTEPASSTSRGEDCLSLNIWTSSETSDSDEPKDVMVFIHGGAFSWGGTTDEMYNGENFAKAHPDTIIVTINYRLGLMGFADFSQIEGGEDYTDVNLALRDQIAALEWVQKNISAFGGNPDNVTVFGESAGGFSVSALVVSPMARGLFKQAIIESGGLQVADKEDAQEYAEFICEASGCDTMDELNEITAEEWIELDEENWIGDENPGLVVDNETIPAEEDWDAEMKAKIDDGVKVMLGTNEDEMNYFQADMDGDTAEERFDTWVSESLDPVWDGVYDSLDSSGKAQMDDLYSILEEKIPEDYKDADDEVTDALTKSRFQTESWRLDHIHFAERYAAQGGTVYMYRWDVPSTLDEYYKSAVHAVELAYVFNNTDDGIYAGEVDGKTAERAQEAWVNFATTGDPSIEETEWTPYDEDDRNTMMIEKDGWKMEADPDGNIREIMESLGASDMIW